MYLYLCSSTITKVDQSEGRKVCFEKKISKGNLGYKEACFLKVDYFQTFLELMGRVAQKTHPSSHTNLQPANKNGQKCFQLFQEVVRVFTASNVHNLYICIQQYKNYLAQSKKNLTGHIYITMLFLILYRRQVVGGVTECTLD